MADEIGEAGVVNEGEILAVARAVRPGHDAQRSYPTRRLRSITGAGQMMHGRKRPEKPGGRFDGGRILWRARGTY